MGTLFAALGGRKVTLNILAVVAMAGVVVLAALGKVSAEVAVATLLALAGVTGATNASIASEDKAKREGDSRIEEARLYSEAKKAESTPTVAGPETTTPEVPRG